VQQTPAEVKTSEASKDHDNGQAEFSLARQYLGEASSREAKAKAAVLLWIAVGKGSSEAEVELADLYGRGEGVQKNCQQARILLAAARRENNPLEGKESAELHVYGCR
jgi:TPR repeat protein